MLRRSFHNLELVNRLGALPVSCSEAVSPGVATADDNYGLAFGRDWRSFEFSKLDLICWGQILHGLMNAVEISAGERRGHHVSPVGCPTGEDHCVVIF